MTDLSILLRGAIGELDCPRCSNNPRGITRGNGETDECPECHGNHRNVGTIELLRAIVARLDGPVCLDAESVERIATQVATRLQKAQSGKVSP